MQRNLIKIVVLSVIMLAFFAPPCLAKAKGYCYVVAYSFREKVAFFTPVFMKQVRNVSYSAEEFTTEVELVREMESAFEQHIRQALNFNAPDLTVSFRGAYKNTAIADKRLKAEKQEYTQKSFEIREVKSFEF